MNPNYPGFGGPPSYMPPPYNPTFAGAAPAVGPYNQPAPSVSVNAGSSGYGGQPYYPQPPYNPSFPGSVPPPGSYNPQSFVGPTNYANVANNPANVQMYSQNQVSGYTNAPAIQSPDPAVRSNSQPATASSNPTSVSSPNVSLQEYSTDDLGIVLKKDVMSKSPLLKNFKMKSGSCQKRWFLLTTNFLRYCGLTSKGDLGKVKGDVPLSSITVVEALDPQALKQPYIFQVGYRTNKCEELPTVLYVHADFAKQQMDWIRAIKAACLKANAELSPRYHPGVWRDGRFSCCSSSTPTSGGCAAATPSW